jgi:thiamine kinase-like enzyme
LTETIKDFHSTDKRYKKFIEDIKIDSEGRVKEVAPEIVYILKREDLYSLITEQLGSDEIPLRVTHNDTKVNNVLMNKDTGDYLAVIDLDTVMPGSLLFDYGDGVRSTASTSKEDETDLSKVSLDLDLFKAYTDGYLSEMASYMTYDELTLMGESIRIITLELAIRFLNDYINGDTYFKIAYPTHNLDRARNQLALVQDIESKLDVMNSYIMDSYNKYKEPVKKLVKNATK